MTHPTWTVCVWSDDYWHKPSEGWEPVLSGLTLCAAMQIVDNLEGRGWDRDATIYVHNFTPDEIFQAWKNHQPVKPKAEQRSVTKAVTQKTLFGE